MSKMFVGTGSTGFNELLISPALQQQGLGVPTHDPGDAGQFYLDEASSDVYVHLGGGTWQFVGGASGGSGSEGPMGPPGPAGEDGADGEQGSPGPMGATGATGLAGADGQVGPQGSPGNDGTDGVSGEQGPQGVQGIQGVAGADGAVGATGAQGPPGQDGADGADGAQGPIGATGATGPAGANGIDGAVGPQGPPGNDGEQGPEGPQGPAGRDANATRTINFVIDGGGDLIATGSKGYLVVDAPCVITKWTILGDVSGSAVVDIKRSTYAGFPTTASMVGAGNKPTLASVQNNQAVPASWTSVVIAAGDILEFNVDSATTVTRVTVALTVQA